jgi:hypothetical protein
MSAAASSPEERYAALAEELLATTDATREGRGFGSEALKVRGRIFAMLSRGRLVVKLPAARVTALVESGDGERFDPRGDGRLMREWLALSRGSGQDWAGLAREAREFVAGAR